jgi:hypothetical protein
VNPDNDRGEDEDAGEEREIGAKEEPEEDKPVKKRGGEREETRPAGEYVALKSAQEKETEGSRRVSKEDDMGAIGEVFVCLGENVALVCMRLIVRNVVRLIRTYQLEKGIEVIVRSFHILSNEFLILLSH